MICRHCPELILNLKIDVSCQWRLQVFLPYVNHNNIHTYSRNCCVKVTKTSTKTLDQPRRDDCVIHKSSKIKAKFFAEINHKNRLSNIFLEFLDQKFIFFLPIPPTNEWQSTPKSLSSISAAQEFKQNLDILILKLTKSSFSLCYNVVLVVCSFLLLFFEHFFVFSPLNSSVLLSVVFFNMYVTCFCTINMYRRECHVKLLDYG